MGPTQTIPTLSTNMRTITTVKEMQAPDSKEMYPKAYSTYVQVRDLQNHLCGKSRAGHFVGVATVVMKLFNIVKPHFAVFGQKDYQQLKVIERMVNDLNMDIEIIGHPTVREQDGLAMSSRNTYLSPDERSRALLISASLTEAERLFRNGTRDAALIQREVERVLKSKEGVDIEYVSIADPDTLEDVKQIQDKALVAIACHVGKTRLIDNKVLTEEHNA